MTKIKAKCGIVCTSPLIGVPLLILIMTGLLLAANIQQAQSYANKKFLTGFLVAYLLSQQRSQGYSQAAYPSYSPPSYSAPSYSSQPPVYVIPISAGYGGAAEQPMYAGGHDYAGGY